MKTKHQNPATRTPTESTPPATLAAAATEPVRSRWTPKPEQILILESIFNSGMVNPPREETVRIRMMLEKFGAVGDANVFYWFQNRRSRSRRRQRQLQASLAPPAPDRSAAAAGFCSSCSTSSSSGGVCFCSQSLASSSSSPMPPSSSSVGSGWYDNYAGDLFSVSQRMGGGAAHQHHQLGTVAVYINGVLTEVPTGPMDTRSVFGQNAILVHSSGEAVAVNEYGVTLQGLQMGESYFLLKAVGYEEMNKIPHKGGQGIETVVPDVCYQLHFATMDFTERSAGSERGSGAIKFAVAEVLQNREIGLRQVA
ncbi:WUSCHEL-related homeobox 11 [Platanthera zijinensis]|uniref:WUSCHEL-related homeobox 11 n=1 Tax=Platanthera zijinensis TaxID=2320716 RepID=A0AAP0BKY6_9ASPA